MTQDTSTATPQTIAFAVEGMTCGSCVRHVREALDEHFDLLTQEVDLSRKTLTVTFEPGAASEAAIAQVMNEAGYPVRKI